MIPLLNIELPEGAMLEVRHDTQRMVRGVYGPHGDGQPFPYHINDPEPAVLPPWHATINLTDRICECCGHYSPTWSFRGFGYTASEALEMASNKFRNRPQGMNPALPAQPDKPKTEDPKP